MRAQMTQITTMEPSFVLKDYAFAYQPILGANGSVQAFELLHRRPLASKADISNDMSATAEVVINVFNHASRTVLFGSRKAFINVSEDMLSSEMLTFLPRDQVVLELLETNSINLNVLERCHELKALGYSIALDDFELERINDYAPLLDIADVIKVDLMLAKHDELPELVRLLKHHSVKLLAEKVETVEDFQLCKKLGFDMFQGYFFSKPSHVAGKCYDPPKMTVLQLLGHLNRNVQDRVIEDTFKQDVGLSYNLVRLVNSPAFGFGMQIDSVRQALSVLGRRQLSRWLQILLFALDGASEYPSALFELAAKRGKFLELLVRNFGGRELRERAYMTGMLSLADTLLAMSMAEVIQGLNLADEISDALLSRTGDLGKLLSLCEGLEQANFELVEHLSAELSIDLVTITEAQDEAMIWVKQLAQAH